MLARYSKAHFFDEIDTATIFNYPKFIDYIDDKNFLIDSYTKFVNKVGLTISSKHIKEINEVVLSFPFKDCVLRAKRLLPLMIRLSLIKPFSLRLKFTLSLTPFWVYFSLGLLL
jgi:hypothetical protein